MEINILKNTKTELEAEIKTDNPVLLEMLIGKLNEDEDVEFAAYSWEHPLIKSQRFYVRVKKGSIKDKIEKTLKEIKKELKKLKDDVK